MSESILISILSINRVDGAKDCINAVLRHAPGCRIILTDNASTDGTPEYFDELARVNPNITVFHERENTGFQYGHNRAFRLAAIGGNRFFFCLNDDVIISNETVDALVSEFTSDANLAICGDSSGCSEITDNFNGTGGKLEYVEASAMMVNVPMVAGLRPNLFSDELDFAYGEDSDLSLFVRERGFNIKTVDTKIKHLRGQTKDKSTEIRKRCERSQAHNHDVNMRRWRHYLKVRKMGYPILIKREAAVGDVILTTPIIRAIKEGLPTARIYVETRFPELFDECPWVESASQLVPITPETLVIDLNYAYENMPKTHIVHAYEKVARAACEGMAEVDLRTELFLSDAAFQNSVLKTISGRKIAVVHTDRSHWQGKNIPLPTMVAVVEWMNEHDFVTIGIGTSNDGDRVSRIKCMTNLNGSLNFKSLAQLMKSSSLFFGPDSAPFHFAQAMGCPSVVAYGCTRARFIATRGAPHSAVESHDSVPGSGERHFTTGKVYSSATSECMESIKPEEIIEAIKKLEI